VGGADAVRPAGDRILLHGSVGAGALRHVAAGAPAALSVMHIDAWVYAHTLFDSSANYRSRWCTAA